MSLVAQFEQAVATQAKRCKPFCRAQDYVDSRPENNKIRTTCSQCGTFIGYRPIDDKTARRDLKHNADTVICPVCESDSCIPTGSGNFICTLCGGHFVGEATR